MTLRKRDVRDRLARLILEGLARNAPTGHFSRLKKSFFKRNRVTACTIYSKYYWARFVNDGRKAIYNKNMIWFRDPDDDPRIQQDWAKKRAGVKHLTRRQFLRYLRAGKLVIRHSTPSRLPTRFIEHSVQEARTSSRKEVRVMIKKDVRAMIRRNPDQITVRF